jgi:DNA-directed RNA polymerase beta subunit
LRPDTKHSNNQILVNIPNVRKPVPLFILMRALGITSDKEIIKMCLLDLKKYENYITLFTPSIYDAGNIFNQEVALKYLATLTKGKTLPHILEILMDYLLPHIGENNFIELIENGIVRYDNRLGIYRTGEKKGNLHNHGGGFRINAKNLDKLFATKIEI